MRDRWSSGEPAQAHERNQGAAEKEAGERGGGMGLMEEVQCHRQNNAVRNERADLPGTLVVSERLEQAPQ